VSSKCPVHTWLQRRLRNSVRYCDSRGAHFFCLTINPELTKLLFSIDASGGVEWTQENPIKEVLGHRVYNRPVSCAVE